MLKTAIFILLITLPITNGLNLVEPSITIAASNEVFAAIVKEIVGPYANVFSILPPGTDPHSYSPTIEDINKIKSSDLLVLANPDFLEFERRILENVNDKPFLTLDNYTKYGLTIIRTGELTKNYHGYWTHPLNALAISKAVTNALTAIDPENKDYYMSKLDLFEEKINSLIDELNKLSSNNNLDELTSVAIIPAVAYILNACGISVGVLLVGEPGQTPSPSKYAEVSQKLEQGVYDIIVTDEVTKGSSIGNLAEQLRDDTKKPLIYIRSLSLGGISDFTALILYDVGLIIGTITGSGTMASSGVLNTISITMIGILTIIAIIEGFIIFKMKRAFKELI